MLLRAGGELFHTHAGAEPNGSAYSAPCNACDLEATATLNGPEPPALPVITFQEFAELQYSESHPFVPIRSTESGRAPPEA